MKCKNCQNEYGYKIGIVCAVPITSSFPQNTEKAELNVIVWCCRNPEDSLLSKGLKAGQKPVVDWVGVKTKPLMILIPAEAAKIASEREETRKQILASFNLSK